MSYRFRSLAEAAAYLEQVAVTHDAAMGLSKFEAERRKGIAEGLRYAARVLQNAEITNQPTNEPLRRAL